MIEFLAAIIVWITLHPNVYATVLLAILLAAILWPARDPK